VHPRFAEAEVLVAERDGRIVGTIAFYPDVRLEAWTTLPTGWAGFRALAVHPRARCAGIGQALVRHCIERTCDIGAETLGLHTISLLMDAVRLYERLGFFRCPEFDLPAADIFPSERADEITALAFRLDVGAEAQAIGPRTVTEPGSTT
jgi:predicted N-acetyltransferase YhbS